MNALASEALFDTDVANLPRLATLRGWTIHKIEFPVIDVSFNEAARKTLRVRLIANDWNDLPPSIELLEADGTFIPVNSAPVHPIFNQSAHPTTGRPFICMIGTLEYHTHTSHIPDVWENYRGRGDATVSSLLTQIWNGWLQSVK